MKVRVNGLFTKDAVEEFAYTEHSLADAFTKESIKTNATEDWEGIPNYPGISRGNITAVFNSIFESAFSLEPGSSGSIPMGSRRGDSVTSSRDFTFATGLEGGRQIQRAMEELTSSWDTLGTPTAASMLGPQLEIFPGTPTLETTEVSTEVDILTQLDQISKDYDGI